jgi:exopolyphosphatase/guanosine-5'-triphosphate,3'-diphosphate pyrophosphatase
MRIAIVDVGTNTVRLFIADVAGQRVQRTHTRLSRVIRLGAGVDASGRLAEDAMARAYAVLAHYAELIRAAHADRAVAVMTSAVRDAANGADFASEVAARYAIESHILTGDAEAALTYRGATAELSPDGRERILVADIGGGSTELVLGRGTRADFHVSTQAGVVRQSDRHLTTDPPSEAELAALSQDVASTLSDGVPEPQRTGVERTLAVAGTPTSLAAIDMALEPYYDPRRVHGHTLSRERVAELFARLRRMSLAERRTLTGMHPDRANVIIPGAAILVAVMDLFGLEQVEVSEHDILRGAALHYAEDGSPGA